MPTLALIVAFGLAMSVIALVGWLLVQSAPTRPDGWEGRKVITADTAAWPSA
ncbi:MAG: hypothetical protein AB7F97_09130 [Solirubrobacterales bacterium]